jgi:MFS family permease
MSADHRRHNQFALLRQRRFLPFFLTQFSGAFNDNLFKSALLVLLVSGAIAGERVDTVINLAAGLFILPFFLFSPLAGQLADKYDKARIIRWVKLAEVLIMVLAAVAFRAQAWGFLLVLLFAMGTQSAFFGPLKYAIIPQHLDAGELVAGNAQVGMGTFTAILLGTIGGTMLAGRPHPELGLGVAVVLVALLGWFASRGIPEAPAAAPALRLDWHPVREWLALYRQTAPQRGVFLAIIGISWFWALGASYLTQIPNFAVAVLGGTPPVITLVLSVFVVGVAAGGLLCGWLSGPRIEIGLVPLGAAGLSLFGLDLSQAATEVTSGPERLGPLMLLTQLPILRILADVLLLGLSGGLYAVPLYAHVQAHTAPDRRARVIALNNILNALFMVVASVLGILLLGVARLGIPRFFLVLALLNAAVAALLFTRAPEFLSGMLAWMARRV